MARKSRKNLPQPEQAAASVLLPELEEAKMPAAIYGRLSVEDEETEESMETQIALVQDYINRSRELSYVDTYFDNGFTGTNFKRPAFTRLMNDADRWICDFYDTAGGRRRGSTSGTGGSNASAGMVHIRCQTRIARLWNCLNKSNALIVERISIFSTMRVFHSAGM